MLNFLLMKEGYPPAVLFAVLLHAALIWFMLDRVMTPSEMVTIQPAAMAVVVARENPQKLRRIQEVQQQRVVDERAQDEARAREQAAREREATQKAETERKLKAETDRQKAEQQKQDQARKAEADRQAAARQKAEEDKQRQAKLQEQQKREAEQRTEAERQSQAQAQATITSQSSGADSDLVSQYAAIVKDLITQNWTLPPSSRNGMQALVELRTTPIGDITSSTIIQSSGDAAFDRSVLQAVARVGTLPELRDLPNDIYERNFRRFNLLFQPEDLLR
jgi:colicin import membrane protein